MSGVLHGVIASLKTAVTAVTDAYFKYVSLLLNTTSINGAQNNTFLDSSANAFSITRNGNTTQGTFSPFSQTGWSNYFDGTGDYITAPANAAWVFSGNVTFECWIYISGDSALDSGSLRNAVLFRNALTGSVNFQFMLNGNSTTTGVGLAVYTSSGLNYGVNYTFNKGTWYHVAVARASNVWTFYVDGVATGTPYTYAGTFGSSTRTMEIGGSAYSGYPNVLNGYISNARMVNGTAVYTANFTPPTAPLTAITNTSLLTCQSNRLIDNSTNNFTITRNGDTRVEAFSPFNPTAAWDAATNGGSGYFDGTGDYLTAPDNAAFDFGSGDFTVELWYYPQALPAETTLVSKWNNSGVAGTNQWLVWLAGATASATISTDGSTAAFVATGPNVVLSQWNHIAYVRNGNNFTVYTNGVGGTPQTNSGSLYALDTEVLGIGYRRNGGSPVIAMNGYASQVRIVKGTAVYTANFTPPTAPLTAISGTSLLLNFTNAGIYDSAAGNDVETVGGAQVSTTRFKWGTTSMYTPAGGTNYLVILDKPRLRFGTGAFTIELWFNPVSSSAAAGIIGKGNPAFPQSGWQIALTVYQTVQFTYVNSVMTSTSTVAVGVWCHIAIVREGTGTNQTKLYFNGVNEATGTVSNDFNETQSLFVFAARQGSSKWTDYIDDLRITNGYARYTGNFTPPTAAFPLN